MTNREELTWTHKRVLGVQTYHADTKVGGLSVGIIIDKPYSNGWVLRVWVDGRMSRYRDHTTLANAKVDTDEYLTWLTWLAEAKAADGGNGGAA